VDAEGLPTQVTAELKHEFSRCLWALLQQFGIILGLCLIVMWYALFILLASSTAFYLFIFY
jgi:hypothetical protein